MFDCCKDRPVGVQNKVRNFITYDSTRTYIISPGAIIAVIVWHLDLQLPMQSVPITTHWCCDLESRSGRCVQYYVIKFVSDLQQLEGFLLFLRFPPPIKLTAAIYLIYCWKCSRHHQTNKQTNIYKCNCTIFFSLCNMRGILNVWAVSAYLYILLVWIVQDPLHTLLHYF